MKYERLTIKRENGFATVRNTTLQGLIDRLASLEDKIERGELCDRDEVRKETARTCIILAKQYQNSKEIVRDIAEKYSIDLRNEECEERRMKDHEERYIDSLFIAFDEMGLAPTTVCPDPEKYAIEWREKVRAEFERLEIENAALRERLKKAIELPFYVFDKKTGKEADEYEIALHEDWAKHLMYCDMKGFAIEQDGTLILLDECGQFVYCSSDRFEVVPEARLAELKGEKK